MTFKQVYMFLLSLVMVALLSACQSKPSTDKSVDYKSARSIPSLDVSAEKAQANTEKSVKR